MNFLKREKKDTKKELRKNLDIQMSNNKKMREIIRKEQTYSRNLLLENKTLAELYNEEKSKSLSLKKQIRRLYAQNKEIYELLEDLRKTNIDIDKMIRNKKIEIRKSEKPKRKYTRKVKKDEQ